MYLGVPVEAFSPAGRALRHCANAPAASFVTHCVRSSVQWPFAASATAPSARWLHALTRFTKKRSLELWHKREYERILKKNAYKKVKIEKLYAQKAKSWAVQQRIPD